MISIIISSLLAICMGVATIWTSKLYIENHTYVRDIYLALSGFMNIAWNIIFIIYHITENYNIIPLMIPLGLLQFLLVSLFIMGNVSVSSVKWISNIFSSISFTAIIYSCVFKNLVITHFMIIVIGLLTSIFMILNNNSRLNKLFYTYMCSVVFFFVYILNLFIIETLSSDILLILVIVSDLTALSFTFYRIGILREALGIPSLRAKLFKRK